MPNPAAVATGFDSVWVYPDRKVGLRTMPGSPLPSYRFVIAKPFSAKWRDENTVKFQPYEYEEFFLVGTMFDGRPIYAQKGRIEQAVNRGFAAKPHQDKLDDLNRNMTRRLCKEKFGRQGYIELDEHYGDAVQFEIDLKATHSVYREARLLVYV